MKNCRKIGLLTICGICCLFVANLYAAISLYDDFSKPLIDTSKWDPTEFVREVDPVQGKLVSKVRGYSDQNGFLRNNLGINYSKPLTEIKSKINVVAGDLSIGNNTRILARVGGYFYNTQSSGTSALGNVWVEVDIIEAGNGLTAIYQIEEQLTSDQTGPFDLTEGIIGTAGTLQYGTSYEAKIEYNSGNQFIFSVTGPGLTTLSTTAQGPARVRNATSNSVSLATGIDSVGPGNYGYISATFDDIYVNTDLYDDFSVSPIQPSKWSNNELVREVSNGELRLNIHGIGSQVTNRMPLLSSSDFLQADVLIESSSYTKSTNGFVRLASYFYNDSRGPDSGLPYDGDLGNVYVTVRIILNPDGSLTAKAGAWRVDDPSFTTETELISKSFPTQILFDTPYTLSIEFTGSQLIFKCNNDILTYSVSTAVFPPSNKFRAIESRVYSGGSGYIKARVDDVYVYGTEGNQRLPLPPSGQNLYSYSHVENPVENVDPSLCQPIGVGDVEGGSFSLKLGLLQLEGPANIYLALFVPALDPVNLYLFGSDNSLRPVSQGLVPWKASVIGPINESLFENLSTSLLPPGAYYLALLLTPVDSLATQYLWLTDFTIP